MHTTSIACRCCDNELITHEQYRTLSRIEIDFYKSEIESTHWIKEVISRHL